MKLLIPKQLIQLTTARNNKFNFRSFSSGKIFQVNITFLIMIIYNYDNDNF